MGGALVSVTSRAQSATRFGLKVQRRVVIAQALWWPTLILSAIGIGLVAAIAVKRRTAAALPQRDPVPAVSTAAALT